MMVPKRKKWTEAEEKALIDKYGEMVADGTLAKMKTRERNYKPIVCYVNSVHHVRDSFAYPRQWSWKDVSTKVQNMRHQYLLVKQKIKKADDVVDNPVGGECTGDDGFDWLEGLTHWLNFLRYKEVFGDVAVSYNSTNNNNSNNSSDTIVVANEEKGHLLANGVLGLGFEFDGDEGAGNYNGNDQVREEGDDDLLYEEVEPNESNLKKKRKVLKGLEKKAFGFLMNQLGQLRELEARFEQRESERERERKRKESVRLELEKEWERKLEEREKEGEEREKEREKLRRQRIGEWEAMEKESEERERRRKEDDSIPESEWEERLNRKKSEWRKRMDETLNQHRAEMNQMQTRFLHEQQNLTSQLIGIVSQWTGHPAALSDHTASTNHYLSQMMQNLHHVNGMVHGDDRDNQDDQFIVDG
ncbi:RNA recognition motif-containing family protein [Hibiscus syriacus]|uniref:RNA recognition motif-containing family protein n=1 Tax=Hibiscus syriacus TaxID=106335 RepID=A0A6A3CVL0_HIBSY|nr:RNA recognition motif-containing family protein [Hibiscus syriacus]